MARHSRWLYGLTIGISILCYSPGLHGPFIFDDYATLPGLTAFARIKDAGTLAQAVANGIAGPLGRPLSLISFILNSPTWPAAPWSFKATNVALHCAVGLTLFLLLLRLPRPPGEKTATGTALFVASLWLLQPYNVSTVLYVVQRMAMLSALFSAIGLLGYVHGRQVYAKNAKAGLAWMGSSLFSATLLAVLCKENGALLPLLALVLEYTLLRHAAKLPPLPWRVALPLLWLPSLALVPILLQYATPTAYAMRTFSLEQRLMTESRVLWDYLYHWFNPYAVTRGVLAEDYPISTGLLRPWTTLPSLLAIAGAFAWSIWQRARHPYGAFAILFFLAGHTMESTILPLEIYFEHRNYLPSLFLALPVANWAAQAHGHHQRLVPILGMMVLLAAAAQTHRLAKVWSSEVSLAVWSVEHHPDSGRARDFLASSLANAGRSDLAVGAMQAAIRDQPENSHFYLHYLAEKCRAGGISPEDISSSLAQFSRQPLSIKSFPLLGAMVAAVPDPQCRGLEVGVMLNIVDVLSAHAEVRADSERMRQLQHFRGELQIKAGAPQAALQSFAGALALRPDIGTGMQQVSLLASRGYYAEALQWLARVERLPRPSGKERLRQPDYDLEIARVRGLLESDLASQNQKKL